MDGDGGRGRKGAGAAGFRIGQAALAAALIAWTSGPARGTEADSSRADSSAGSEAPRSPKGALLRSLALPGWGQFYNGKVIKGSLIAAAETASVAAFFIREDQLEEEVRQPGEPPKRNVFLFSTLGIIFYSAVDAYVDAHLAGVEWGELEVRGTGVRAKVGRVFDAPGIAIRVEGFWEVSPLPGASTAIGRWHR